MPSLLPTNTPLPILDVRPSDSFQLHHAPDSVNIPLEHLSSRIHELPPTGTHLLIYDLDPARAQSARDILHRRGRWQIQITSGPDRLSSRPRQSGPSTHRLWQPNPLLLEALDHARAFWPAFNNRPALDIACGSGREAVYLALHGFSVTALDHLPDAIARCLDLARHSSVTLRAIVHNIESQPDLQPDAYDLICVFNFLHRPLMPIIAAALRPGGLLIYETFNEQHRAISRKPSRDAHLLKLGELPAYFPNWQILVHRESPTPTRSATSLIARKTVPPL